MASNLLAMASNLLAVASNLHVEESNVFYLQKLHPQRAFPKAIGLRQTPEDPKDSGIKPREPWLP